MACKMLQAMDKGMAHLNQLITIWSAIGSKFNTPDLDYVAFLKTSEVTPTRVRCDSASAIFEFYWNEVLLPISSHEVLTIAVQPFTA